MLQPGQHLKYTILQCHSPAWNPSRISPCSQASVWIVATMAQKTTCDPAIIFFETCLQNGSPSRARTSPFHCETMPGSPRLPGQGHSSLSFQLAKPLVILQRTPLTCPIGRWRGRGEHFLFVLLGLLSPGWAIPPRLFAHPARSTEGQQVSANQPFALYLIKPTEKEHNFYLALWRQWSNCRLTQFYVGEN